MEIEKLLKKGTRVVNTWGSNEVARVDYDYGNGRVDLKYKGRSGVHQVDKDSLRIVEKVTA